MRKAILLTGFILLHLSSFSQVANNSIENRIKLNLDDDWFVSSTTNSNVEWDCINRALTSACLVYHNDQWFTFTPVTTGPYYVNISGQQCKNKQGVQIIVMEGDPCKIDTYRLIECIPYTDNSDMYVRMDNLKPDTEYLVNIDGYLGDLCDFKIQVSPNLKGIPAGRSNLNVLKTEAALKDSIVTISWRLPDTLMYRLSGFMVYRKHDLEKRVTEVADLQIFRNSLGNPELTYRISDTLHRHGLHRYSIYGSSNREGLIMLGETQILYRPDYGRRPVASTIGVQFHCKGNSLVTLEVFDDSNEKRLYATTRRGSKGSNKFVLDLTRYVESGIYFFKVVASDSDNRSEQYFSFKDKMIKQKTQSN